jgi:hypothetical protein
MHGTSQDCAGFLDDGTINHVLVRNVSIMERFEKVVCLKTEDL